MVGACNGGDLHIDLPTDSAQWCLDEDDN